MRVYNEEFLAETSEKDLGSIIELVQKRDWLMHKMVNPVFHKNHRDLLVTPIGCLLYENRLVIPAKSRPMVLQTIHSKQPRQAGMLALARLAWCPLIHSEIVAQKQSCRHCFDKNENLKPLIQKKIGTIPTLTELNKEIQMDFADPVPFKKAYKITTYR